MTVVLEVRPTAECGSSDAPGTQPRATRQEILAQYDFVFSGKIIEAAPHSSDTFFEVDRVWKGTLHRRASFLIPAAKMRWVTVGHTYLMLLRQCHDCVGTRRLLYEVECSGGMDVENETTQALLKQLGPGKRPGD